MATEMTEEKRGDTTSAQVQKKIPAYVEKFIAGFLSSNYWSDTLTPPGCYETGGPHNITKKVGATKGDIVPVAAMFEHRYSFYYWALWARKAVQTSGTIATFIPPNLFTLDAHDDFGGDCDFKSDEFEHIAYDKTNEMALFSWLRLHPNNDGQIYPAVMLNLVGDVYLLNRQYRENMSSEDYTYLIMDIYGHLHQIKYIDSLNELGKALDSPDPESRYMGQDRFYLDIDLDFFFYGQTLKEFQQWSPAAIREFFESDIDVVRRLVQNVGGITFALEPSHTLGLSSSLRQYDVVQQILFTNDPLGERSPCDWKECWKS